jgi:hypothetical protein
MSLSCHPGARSAIILLRLTQQVIVIWLHCVYLQLDVRDSIRKTLSRIEDRRKFEPSGSTRKRGVSSQTTQEERAVKDS